MLCIYMVVIDRPLSDCRYDSALVASSELDAARAAAKLQVKMMNFALKTRNFAYKTKNCSSIN